MRSNESWVDLSREKRTTLKFKILRKTYPDGNINLIKLVSQKIIQVKNDVGQKNKTIDQDNKKNQNLIQIKLLPQKFIHIKNNCDQQIFKHWNNVCHDLQHPFKESKLLDQIKILYTFWL